MCLVPPKPDTSFSMLFVECVKLLAELRSPSEPH